MSIANHFVIADSTHYREYLDLPIKLVVEFFKYLQSVRTSKSSHTLGYNQMTAIYDLNVLKGRWIQYKIIGSLNDLKLFHIPPAKQLNIQNSHKW